MLVYVWFLYPHQLVSVSSCIAVWHQCIVNIQPFQDRQYHKRGLSISGNLSAQEAGIFASVMIVPTYIVWDILCRFEWVGKEPTKLGTAICSHICTRQCGMVPTCTRRIHRTMNMGGTQAHVVLIVAAADQLMSLSSFHRPPADLPVMGDTRTPTDTSLTLRGHYDHKRNGRAGGSRGVRIHKVPEIMFS